MRGPKLASGGAGREGRGSRRIESGNAADLCDRAGENLARQLSSALDYPSWARSLRYTGTLRLSLRISVDGRPIGVRVVSSSGHEALDRHTVNSVRRLHDVPRCPRPIVLPVTFRYPEDRWH